MKKILNNPWPYAIMAWFALAITGMVIWITVAVRNDHELVRKDYYEAELRFQTQFDSVQRTKPIRKDVAVAYEPSRESVTVKLPASHHGATGVVHFYRPSEAKLDRKFDLQLSEAAVQELAVKDMKAGLWKVQVAWTVNGVQYYFDQPLMLAGTQ
ncbi:MAG TPA: FixH family protein [Methylomirabilota bacterium]|nr:FixH family protein [Methylomirabilota bacterium]